MLEAIITDFNNIPDKVLLTDKEYLEEIEHLIKDLNEVLNYNNKEVKRKGILEVALEGYEKYCK
jgi:hypothetical protein